MVEVDIWDEYKYRHDLLWKKIHQFTIIMVFLGAAPHSAFTLEQSGKNLIQLLPIIGTLFGIFGIFVLKNELSLFMKIKNTYRGLQNEFMAKFSNTNPGFDIPEPFHASYDKFSYYLWIYYCFILLLSFLNCFSLVI